MGGAVGEAGLWVGVGGEGFDSWLGVEGTAGNLIRYFLLLFFF